MFGSSSFSTHILFDCPELTGLDWLGELLVKPDIELHTASSQPSQRLQSSRTSCHSLGTVGSLQISRTVHSFLNWVEKRCKSYATLKKSACLLQILYEIAQEEHKYYPSRKIGANQSSTTFLILPWRKNMLASSTKVNQINIH